MESLISRESFSPSRPDRTLKSLVFKLVPGLYEAETKRVIDYQLSTGKSLSEAIQEQQHEEDIEEEIFFSPEEPIR